VLIHGEEEYYSSLAYTRAQEDRVSRFPQFLPPYSGPTKGKTRADGERSWRAPRSIKPVEREEEQRTHSRKESEVQALPSSRRRRTQAPTSTSLTPAMGPMSLNSPRGLAPIKRSPLRRPAHLRPCSSPPSISPAPEPECQASTSSIPAPGPMDICDEEDGGAYEPSVLGTGINDGSDNEDSDDDYEASPTAIMEPGSPKAGTKRRKRKSGNSAGRKKSKNFQCQYCPLSFSRSADRVRHQQSACRDAPVGLRTQFTCDVCQQAFNRDDALKRHKAAKHKGC